MPARRFVFFIFFYHEQRKGTGNDGIGCVNYITASPKLRNYGRWTGRDSRRLEKLDGGVELFARIRR